MVTEDGTVRISPTLNGRPGATGLLTLAPHTVPADTDRISTAIDADVPAGSSVTVDLRGRRANGGWTEWVSASAPGTAVLPEPTREVQARLALRAANGAGPVVRSLTLTAYPAATTAEGGLDAAEHVDPVKLTVFATREGLVGGTTANGHVIVKRDHFVALPSRRALAPRNSGDYTVEICTPAPRCAFAPVWDIGPWNINDDYWNPPEVREQWKDLPHGMPMAQAAFFTGYHDGKDQFNRTVVNPAGIDLADGLFWDALGLSGNSWVTVSYLWTGSDVLAPVSASAPVEVRAAPDSSAPVVAIAVPRAAIPMHCTLGDWLDIGGGRYVSSAAVAAPAGLPPCPKPATNSTS